MKVSWKWLHEIVDLQDITLTEFTNKLTLAGFEVEQIYNKEDIEDTIIDIDITANRLDISSLVGIAREISIIFNRQLKENTLEYRNIHTDLQTSNSNLDNFDTIKYISDITINIITDIKNQESPKWLKNRLITYDISPCHVLSDIAQYIQIKWGQNIEIFDSHKIDLDIIQTSLFKICRNDTNHIINTNRIHNNELPYVLMYKKQNLSILGIKCNENLIADQFTSSIILSSHICNSQYLKQITKKLKLRNEKSIKQQTRSDFIYAYNEALDLIINLTKGNISQNYQYHKEPCHQCSIILHQENINAILGPINDIQQRYLSKQEIVNILDQLQFKNTYRNHIFNITIPIHRQHDITREIDIIEEIGRIYGFNHFIDDLPQKFIQDNSAPVFLFTKKIRNILRNLGLHEVIHYSLIKKQTHNQEIISIINPLLEDQSQLRTFLLPNLIKTKQYNVKQKNLLNETFEIGKIFKDNQSKTYKLQEIIHIAAIISNTNYIRYNWSHKPQELTWFQAKGHLEEFLERLHANIVWKQYNYISSQNDEFHKLFHPQRTAILYNHLTNEKIGVFGQLNLKSAKKLQINDLNYIFEMDLYSLMRSINPVSHLNYIIKPYSHYPSVTRDISLILRNNESTEFIKKQILNQNKDLIESIEILNEYKQKFVDDIKRHISFRIRYRAYNRTLNSIDIQQINNQIDELLNHT